jgi:hypothetical protein
MPEPKCGSCGFRGRYDRNPKSIIGRLWRWHIGFCPGWKSYMNSLPEAERKDLIVKYNLKK